LKPFDHVNTTEYWYNHTEPWNVLYKLHNFLHYHDDTMVFHIIPINMNMQIIYHCGIRVLVLWNYHSKLLCFKATILPSSLTMYLFYAQNWLPSMERCVIPFTLLQIMKALLIFCTFSQQCPRLPACEVYVTHPCD